MRKEIVYDSCGNPITRTYNDNGELISESWTSVCPVCGGAYYHHHLADDTGGSDHCYDCGHGHEW